MTTIYLFDGSGGCDICKDATGYAIDVPPIGPHHGCNCPIVQVDPGDVPGCELVLNDLIIDEFIDTEEHQVVVHACNESESMDVGFSIDENVQEGFDEGLRELVDARGWAPPPTEDLSVAPTLGPGQIHTLDVKIERYIALFEADVSYDCTIDGDRVDIPVGPLTGFYEKTYRLLFEHDSDPCPGAPESEPGVIPDMTDDETLAEYLEGEDEDDESTG